MTKRHFCALMTLVAVLTIPVAARADEFLVDFRGFDYESPNNTPGFGNIGDGYNSLGFVPQVNPALLTCNFAVNQYTYQFGGLTAINTESVGAYLFVYYTPGRFRLYEDAISGGTAANYGTNPPNATAPSTFIDGTVILGGQVSNFVLTLDLVSNTGSFNGDIGFDEGSQLGAIPPTQLNGWTFSGLTGGAGTGAPAGYKNQVDGSIYVPNVVPAPASSWGKIKAQYRR